MKHQTLDLINELNEEQYRAVTHVDGPLVVSAGAGSGKTRVITYRIVHLIKHLFAEPRSIVALTFTNKAAQEMKERTRRLLGDEASSPMVTTFHGYALLMIKKYWHKGRDHSISILDEQDQIACISRIMEKYPSPYNGLTARKIAGHISRVKNNTHIPVQSKQEDYYNHIYKLYEQEKEHSYSLDFDDLLIVFDSMLDDEEFITMWRSRVRHLLVDEYQDTNILQHKIIKKLALDKDRGFALDSLCVVGDKNQSIYSWRGAHIQNIIDFEKDFSGTKTINIVHNYRSVKPILETANHLISFNNSRSNHNLVAQKDGHQRVRLIKTYSEQQEADYIIKRVKELKARGINDYAILYRSHNQSRSLEEAFLRHSIPYVIFGGINFYARQEIKDILAYLKLGINLRDRASFLRCYNMPTRGLGDKFEKSFFELWEDHPSLSVIDILKMYLEDERGARARKGIEFLVEILEGINNHRDDSIKALDYVLEKTQYIKYLLKLCESKEFEERRANLDELRNAMAARVHDAKDLMSFLSEVALMTDKEALTKQEEHPVKMMSMHAAKGLEFHTVFIPGLEDGVLPNSRSIDEVQVEEERRLFYVGITRARENLDILHAQTRYTFGSRTYQKESRFLNELPTWIEKIDLSEEYGFKKSYSSFQSSSAKRNTYRAEYAQAAAKRQSSPSKPAFSYQEKVVHDTLGEGIVQGANMSMGKEFVVVKFGAKVRILDGKYLKKIS